MAVNKSDLKLKETKLMSFCQDETKNELNPEVTPCKALPAQKIENRISRRERSSSPKVKLCNREVKQIAHSSPAEKLNESEPSCITEALSAVSVLKLHTFLCSSASESNFRYQLLSQCLQVILECIQLHVLNSNEKVDLHSESVNRIYKKMQNLKTYAKLPDRA